jgi:hypothetical protein
MSFHGFYYVAFLLTNIYCNVQVYCTRICTMILASLEFAHPENDRETLVIQLQGRSTQTEFNRMPLAALTTTGHLRRKGENEKRRQAQI